MQLMKLLVRYKKLHWLTFSINALKHDLAVLCVTRKEECGV